jgi:NAD(P)-dependent dehydrogenase (short-subunit alcohol dehydrogenase family)
VAPGAIKTPMHPLGRMGEVREVVQAVLYLESAAFVTGKTLHAN